jgi:cytochrome bd-type quinol oxidase subunit 1
MNHTQRLLGTALLATAVLLAAFAFAVPRARVARAQDGMVQCDLTLITLLYISEHVYGHFPMTDVSNIDKGQYGPLFDAMMEAMMEMTPTEEAMMEPTEEAMMEGTMLAHGDIPGEPQVCTDLRHELDAWFLDHFMREMEMMADG